MKETILLFQFDKDRAEKIHRALMPLKIRVKTVRPEEYCQRIGYLAGNKEIPMVENGQMPVNILQNGGIEQEMLIMAWLTGHQVDQVLTAFRKQGIGRIDYKAVVTSQNQYWDCKTLYEELKREHEAFMGRA